MKKEWKGNMKKSAGNLTLATITTLFMLSICIAHRANADISLVFDYNALTDITTATYSGNWGTFTIDGMNPVSGNWSNLTPQRFESLQMGTDYTVDFSVGVNGGADLPWDHVTALMTGRTGDNFGFRTDSGGQIYAPKNYIAGTSISGTLVFAGSTLFDLGLSSSDSGIIAVGGTGNNVHLTVPEPATALLLGIGGMGAWLLRRSKLQAQEDEKADA